MKILLLCTGNSCRSQMAEGFLRKLLPGAEIFSAGSKPETQINSYAVKVMAEYGTDISRQKTKNIRIFDHQEFDVSITLCDRAAASCVTAPVKSRRVFHVPFPDPADARGSEEEIMKVYRTVAESIRKWASEWAVNSKETDALS